MSLTATFSSPVTTETSTGVNGGSSTITAGSYISGQIANLSLSPSMTISIPYKEDNGIRQGTLVISLSSATISSLKSDLLTGLAAIPILSGVTITLTLG